MDSFAPSALGRIAVATLLVFMAPVAGASDEPSRDPSVAEGSEPEVLDEPAFPEAPRRGRVRIWTGSFFIPPTDFGEVDLGLARPELRMRAQLPVQEEANVTLNMEFKPSFYSESGGGRLFEGCPSCPSPGNLYSISVALQGGYLLNRNRHLFLEDEQWALVTALYTLARFEPGAFEESITPGLSFGIGYQLPNKLRVALAGRIERALDGDGVKLGPSGYLRWDPAPKWRLRLRGLGLQLEYRILPHLELFATGFRKSDRFRLDDRPDLGSGPTFRDRQVIVGAGFVFKLYSALRFSGELGGVVDRSVSIHTRDDGKVDSNDGAASPYFSFRIEYRP